VVIALSGLLLCAAEAKEPLRVFVLPPANGTGDPGEAHWRGTIAWVVAWELQQLGAVRVTSSEWMNFLPDSSVAFAFTELGLSSGGEISADAAIRLGEVVRADVVLWGSYSVQNGSWELCLRVGDVSSGDVSHQHLC